jgi:restriction alleviation protein Lar
MTPITSNADLPKGELDPGETAECGPLGEKIVNDEPLGALKPCPFCSEQPEYMHTDWRNAHEFWCGNEDCPAEVNVCAEEREIAIAKWNTRATPAPSACREALEQALEALDGLQFTGRNFGCPNCQGQPSTGHAKNCRTAFAIAAARAALSKPGNAR